MYTNVDLSKLSSMKTGGIAPKAFFPEKREELCDTVKKLHSENEKFHVLGNMSNVLVPDGEIPFVPVITTKCTGTEISENDDGTASIYAECGVMLTKFAYDMCKKGFAGMEFAYGIPGTVGGAVFMNAGAYGSEVSAVIEFVDCFDLNKGETVRFSNKDCDFGYRHSIFEENKMIILGASFRLSRGNAEEITAKAKEILQKRIDKQPLEYPSCGSAFKRPEGYFAGELIEKSNLKGVSVGGAQVSEKHAGFIINKGGATTEDVLALTELVKKTVMDNFGVELEPEIKVIK